MTAAVRPKRRKAEGGADKQSPSESLRCPRIARTTPDECVIEVLFRCLSQFSGDVRRRGYSNTCLVCLNPTIQPSASPCSVGTLLHNDIICWKIKMENETQRAKDKERLSSSVREKAFIAELPLINRLFILNVSSLEQVIPRSTFQLLTDGWKGRWIGESRGRYRM